jgi:hypothetical protein
MGVLGGFAFGAGSLATPPVAPESTTAPATGNGACVPRPASPFSQLVKRLVAGEAHERWEFAGIALDELILAYEAELLARPVESVGQAPITSTKKHRRWKKATRWYVSDLEGIREELPSVDDVSLTVRVPESIQLAFAGHVVLIADPRVGGPRLLEGRIWERYCEQGMCDDEAFQLEVTGDGLGAPAPTLPTGSFEQRGRSVCETNDGLVLEFLGHDDVARKRSRCAHIVVELRELGAVLSRANKWGTD